QRGTVKVMTYNLFQGTDFVEILSAQTLQDYLVAANLTLNQVIDSNLPLRMSYMTRCRNCWTHSKRRVSTTTRSRSWTNTSYRDRWMQVSLLFSKPTAEMSCSRGAMNRTCSSPKL